jgi:hypothetical protein
MDSIYCSCGAKFKPTGRDRLCGRCAAERPDLRSDEFRAVPVTGAAPSAVNGPQTLKCIDCGEIFEFGETERLFFESRGFPPPTRCPAKCRPLARESRRKRRQKQAVVRQQEQPAKMAHAFDTSEILRKYLSGDTP